VQRKRERGREKERGREYILSKCLKAGEEVGVRKTQKKKEKIDDKHIW
jgi:hypothetical protein